MHLNGIALALSRHMTILDVAKHLGVRRRLQLTCHQPLLPLCLKICLKEDLKRVWLQVCKVDAKEILDEWIKKARSTSITILKKFANTF
ncbi:MAG: transposase [Deltaproteobacteria bacterium]|nr:transposase [Deltaproteobacteria bacterium]